LEAAVKEVESTGGRALAVPTDVADAAAVEEAAARIESELGPIDVWVNNAMVSVFALFTDTPDVPPTCGSRFREITAPTARSTPAPTIGDSVNDTKASSPPHAGVVLNDGAVADSRTRRAGLSRSTPDNIRSRVRPPCLVYN
jgi:NAD(P)-dependent dehydrogenase (short-subunit alcohol dehydrogenase family)